MGIVCVPKHPCSSLTFWRFAVTQSRSSRRACTLAYALPLFLLLFTSMGQAQTAARIDGSVLDVQNRGILGATITVSNPSTGAAVKTVHTDVIGPYSVDALPAAT